MKKNIDRSYILCVFFQPIFNICTTKKRMSLLQQHHHNVAPRHPCSHMKWSPTSHISSIQRRPMPHSAPKMTLYSGSDYDLYYVFMFSLFFFHFSKLSNSSLRVMKARLFRSSCRTYVEPALHATSQQLRTTRSFGTPPRAALHHALLQAADQG